jgi:hypothetical protein
VWAVTGNFFSDLGVLPAAGRLLTPADVDLSTLASTPVAVIGLGSGNASMAAVLAPWARLSTSKVSAW